MSCYLRHMKEVFALAGIDLTTADRKRADRIIHEITGTAHKDCPRAWAAVKERMAEDREGFVTELARRWKEEAVR